MSKKVKTDLFWLLHLATLRLVVSEEKDMSLQNIEIIGKEIGRRISDHFCSTFVIFDKIKNSEVEKYLKIFLENYVDSVEIKDNYIHFQNKTSDYQGYNGIYLFKIILNSIFTYLNSQVKFEIRGNKIYYNVE